MFRNFSRLAGVAALLLSVSSAIPAAAQGGSVAAALERGDYAAARRMAEAEVGQRPDAALHLAHLEGLIALRSGEAATAAGIFRSILSVAPGFEPSRVSLVVALDRLGQGEAARREVRALAERSADPRLRAAMAARLAANDPTARPRPRTAPAAQGDRTAQVAAAQVPPAVEPAPPSATAEVPVSAPQPSPRRAGVALRFALLPSSNITGGPDTDTVELGGLPFTLDPGARAESGVGLSFGMTAWRRWDLGDGWLALLSGSADLRLYGEAPKDDEAEIGLRLDLSRRMARGGLSFGPRLALLYKDGEPYRFQAGLGVAFEHLARPRLRLIGSAEWLAQDHPDEPFRDGSRLSARLALDWAASPRTVVSVEFPVLREDTRAPHLAHTDTGLGLGVRHSFPAGLTVGVHLFAGQNRYDGVYPGFGVARRDEVQSLRVTLTDRRLRLLGQTPELSVTRRRQESNIPLHDAWSTDFGLTFARRF